MSQSISLTVPLDRRALTAGAEFLQKMADELESEQLGAPASVVAKATQLGRTNQTVQQALASIPNTLTLDALSELENGGGEVVENIMDGITVDEDDYLVSTTDTVTLRPPGVVVDKNGLPWDERIHSGGENKLNKDGTWRKRKNIPDTTVAAVEAELRQLMSATAPATPAAVIAPPPSDVVVPVITDIAPPPVIVAPPAVVIPPPVVTTQTVTGFETVTDWPGFMGAVMDAIKAATLTNAEVLGVLKQFGVPALPLVAKRPDLIPQISAHLSALVLSKQS